MQAQGEKIKIKSLIIHSFYKDEIQTTAEICTRMPVPFQYHRGEALYVEKDLTGQN